MRFLFVDKIHELTTETITGAKSFLANAPMQYRHGEIAPGVISEAVGQLVSWLCIKENDFTARPVFLFADKIQIVGPVMAGETVALRAQIDSRDNEAGTFVFSGEAHVGERLVHAITGCHGYFMPLGDLEDPEITRQRFAALVGDGLKLEGDSGLFDFQSLVDDVVSTQSTQDSQTIVTRKTLRLDERFYADHFPRMPVTPIVMINEMIGQSVNLLLGRDQVLTWRPELVHGVKIRNFVRPGDTVEIKVTVTAQEERAASTVIHTQAEIIKDKKPILRGRYSYVKD